jgi:tRNA 2-thiouridine synthesizing protein A
MSDFDRELDLRGEVCPYTFVKAKLATEEMAAGQVLRILLDFLPAVDDVPRSLTTQGDEVLVVRQLSATDWEVLVKKTA